MATDEESRGRVFVDDYFVWWQVHDFKLPPTTRATSQQQISKPGKGLRHTRVLCIVLTEQIYTKFKLAPSIEETRHLYFVHLPRIWLLTSVGTHSKIQRATSRKHPMVIVKLTLPHVGMS